MSERFIPVSKPSITSREIELVTDAVTSTWVSSLGKYITQFEQEFAHYSDAQYGLALANGTVAIHLALKALGIGPDDEVIMPNFSFIATANAVLYLNAKPVFVDIDPFNLCIDPSKIEAAITPRTKCILPVHIYGHPADMPAIMAIAEKHNLLVVEDAAEAHGATCYGKKVGSWGVCATFSFYGNKNITTGEGGMITTNDKTLYEKCAYLRDHAMLKDKRYWHTEMGFNYRMTNLQAALGCAQMERAAAILDEKARIFESYRRGLDGLKGVSINRTYPWAHNAYWSVFVEFEGFNDEQRGKMMAELRSRGVDNRSFFYLMSDMPYINEIVDTPVARAKSQCGICLPSFVGLTDDDIHYVCETIRDLIS